MWLHHGRSRRARIDLGQWSRSQTSTLRHGQATHDRKMSSRRVGGRLTGSAMSRGRAPSEKRFTAIWARARVAISLAWDLPESRRAPGEMGSRLGRTVAALGEFAFARRGLHRGSRLIPRGRDLQLACISQCAVPARDCLRKAVKIRLTTTAIAEKLLAIRGSKARSGGATSIASGRWPLAPRSPTQAEYDC
jgi:hypothetical protein